MELISIASDVYALYRCIGLVLPICGSYADISRTQQRSYIVYHHSKLPWGEGIQVISLCSRDSTVACITNPVRLKSKSCFYACHGMIEIRISALIRLNTTLFAESDRPYVTQPVVCSTTAIQTRQTLGTLTMGNEDIYARHLQVIEQLGFRKE